MNNVSQQDKKLLLFIGRCSDEWNEASPELVLQVAKQLINKMHQFEKPSMKAWDYIEEAQESLKEQEHCEYWRHTPGYQVAAVMYILLTLAKPNDDWRDEYLARNLAQKIFSQANFNCTKEQADRVVMEIRQLTEPQLFETPRTIPAEEILKDATLIRVDDDIVPDLQDGIPLLTESIEFPVFKYIISDNIEVIRTIHSRIEVHLSSPAKLRDELRRLQDEGLVALPMENPTAIVRELQRIWGSKAPKEGSFKTTWGRVRC